MRKHNPEPLLSALPQQLANFFQNNTKLSCLEPDGSGTHTLLPVRDSNKIIGYEYQFKISRTGQVTMEIVLDTELKISKVVRFSSTATGISPKTSEVLDSLMQEIVKAMLTHPNALERLDITQSTSRQMVQQNREIIIVLIEKSLDLLIAIDDDRLDMSEATELNLAVQISLTLSDTKKGRWTILIPYQFCNRHIHPLYEAVVSLEGNSIRILITDLVPSKPEPETLEYFVKSDSIARSTTAPPSQGAVVCIRAVCRKLGILKF